MEATTDGIERGGNKGHAHPEQRRRPSGEPPALPHELGRSGKFFLLLVLYFVVAITAFLVFPSLKSVFERWDHTRQLWITDLRTPGLTRVMLVVNGLASSWTIRLIRWGVILALIVFRRWRHLFVFLGAIIVTEIVAYNASSIIARPRPLGIPILTGWQGYSMPSRPMAGLAVSAVGAMYALIVAGRPRSIAKWAIWIVLALLGLARVYLGVDHTTDVVMGAVFGVAVGVASFRLFAPNDLFPVSYQRGKAAHLDVGGRRGEAIVAAIRDQLGLAVLDVKPVGLEGSGGSTPLRIKIEATDDEPERYVFAKLYAKSHVRADRWYKLGRTILYGALEDEKPFQSVRRFVEYEDYTLRLLNDLGIPVPRPYGIVEITPEREYMIVMEFFEGAVEIGDAEIDDGVIDQGLGMVRRMWDEGLAHRDIKPANLMVRDGELKLIDVFFVQVRPSPWRQAVDLANMMLVLALRTDADRVYAHALGYFSEDEIAEGFAAARGVASPTQLRNNLKQDGRDLLAEFRRIAPEREQVSIQRWSVRRVLLTVGVLFAAWLALGLVVSNWNAFV
ncbi:MAG TPA: phosphatase PAP2 family protein [Actinomycetota bacterium]|jgi:membrane-associated phospholipid phosphatase/tRNA A-37 threonylcarbamoyl transferase component Bud32